MTTNVVAPSSSSSSSSPSSSLRWWESLTDECPITLEPLSTLPYPPFILTSKPLNRNTNAVKNAPRGNRTDVGRRKKHGRITDRQLHNDDETTDAVPSLASATETMFMMGDPDIAKSVLSQQQRQEKEEKEKSVAEQKYYFDGFALASYVVSRAMFQNPLTRESLTWEDCRRLDEYLETYCYHDNMNDESATTNDNDTKKNKNKRRKKKNGVIDTSIDNTNSLVLFGEHGGAQTQRQQRQQPICVCEAFALRESVKVQQQQQQQHSRQRMQHSLQSLDGTNNNGNHHHHDDHGTTTIMSLQNEEEARRQQQQRRRHRAEVLRSEAAAALRGLFVYGNRHRADHRHSTRRTNGTSERYADVVSSVEPSVALSSSSSSAANRQQSIPSFGFDLRGHQRRNGRDGGARYAVEGLTVIDDNEVIGEASDAAAWREVQNAFPRLGTGDATELNQQEANGHESVSSFDEDGGDGDGGWSDGECLLQKVKETSEQIQAKERVKSNLIEQCRRKQLAGAMKRKEEQLRQRQEDRKRRMELEKQIRVESEEIAQARAEIDRWRAEQWEQMTRWTQQERSFSNSGRVIDLKRGDKGEDHSTDDIADRNILSDQDHKLENDHKIQEALVNEEEEKKAAKAAKAAAKKRRARERKKAAKAALDEEKKNQNKEEELKKKKEASSLKCSCCGEGILGCGFDKFGYKFCSPKCARSGPKD